MAADHFEPAPARAQRWSVFVPVFLLALSYLAWAVFQTTQLVMERNTLQTLRSNQEKQMGESKKVRERFEALSRETQLLANRGNPRAQLIMEELRRRGITIRTDAPTQPTPPDTSLPAPAQSAPADTSSPAPAAPQK
jgi:cytoskeletal protein RodZ